MSKRGLPHNLRRLKKQSGVLVPLWALRRARREHDMGIGDTTALVECAEWAAANGLHLLQLLPINETGGDNSPYNAISSRALNPLTLDVSAGALRDLPEDDARAVLRSLPAPGQGPFVDYPAVRALNTAMLRAAFQAFQREASRERREAFETFQRATAAWLDSYSLFRALMVFHGGEQWGLWPSGCRDAASAVRWLQITPPGTRQEINAERQFFAYVQWIAHQQWDSTRVRCERLGVHLMGDIPFGVSFNSADVFAEPHLFDLEWFGGAPPEAYFKDDVFTQRWGQNWGIPLYRWDVMRNDGCKWWRRRVQGVTRYFHSFRIDHILGFYRIYRFPWAPSRNAEFTNLSHEQAANLTGGRLPGFHPRDDWSQDRAEANCAEGGERLRMIIEAANGTPIIGEDLGVVPDYVRPHLQSLGIAIIKVPMWEKTHHGRLLRGADYPELSLATYGTHDHEPLRTLWKRLLSECRNGEEQNESHWTLVNLAEFAGIDPTRINAPFESELHGPLLAALPRANSALAVFMVTDVLGLENRFNLPGSVARTNWAFRLPQPPAEWRVPDALRSELDHQPAAGT